LKKKKGSKEKDVGKGSREPRCLIEGHPCLVAFVYESDNNGVNQRLVEKVQLPTRLSSESSKDQIQYRTMCESSIM